MIYKLYFDGACRGGNDGGAGYVIKDSNERRIAEGCFYIGDSTNNIAEYRALILGLEKAKELKLPNLKVHGDSRLVINQVTGEWKTKKAHLKPLREQAHDLACRIPNIRFKWIPRGMNGAADEKANQSIDDWYAYGRGESEKCY